jgi:hypothetical protein
MSINLNPIYNDKVREFTTSTQNKRFDQDFTVAVNNTLDQLYVAANLDSAINHVSVHDESISALDAKHTFILSVGITYHLLMLGQQKAGKADHMALAKADWEEAKGDMMILTQREDQADVDDDDDPENDIVGLGYKTDTD